MLVVYTLAALVLGTAFCLSAGRKHPWVIQVAYAGAVVASIATAAKLVEPSSGIVLSVAIGLYSMTFLLTDYLGEVHGKQAAMRALYMGIVAELIFLFAALFSVAIEPASFWSEPQKAYETVFGSAPRIIAASLIAFMAAQAIDITVFDFLKNKTKGKYLALRNNISTFCGQTTDTILFYTIAFYGNPNVDIVNLVIITCLVKYLIAIIDTPFIYLATHHAKKA